MEWGLKKNDDVVARTELMVDAEDLKVTVEKWFTTEAVSILKQLGIQVESSKSKTKPGRGRR